MKIKLIKDIKINGIKKSTGLVMEVTNEYGAELIKKKKAKVFTGEIEIVKEKLKPKVEAEIVEDNNETNENNN